MNNTLGISMKKIFILFFVFVIQSQAQWTTITGPGLTNITAFAKRGNQLFVGTNNQGIHVTTDQGNTWQSLNGNLANHTVTSLYAQDTVLLAGITIGSDRGLYLSTDNGKSWKKYTSPFPNSAINVIVKVDTVILAASSSVYRSSNNGGTWQSATSGITLGATITGITAIGSTVFAATSSGHFKSTNLGTSWTQVKTTNSLSEAPYSITSANGNIYTVSYNGGINSGKDTIYKSTNNGETWINIKNNLPASVYGRYLMAYGDTVFFGMQGDGMFRSTNAGQTWHIDTVGLNNKRTQSGFIDGSMIYSGGAAEFGGTGGLYVSTNNGNTWTRKFINLHNGMVTGFVRVGEKLFASVSGNNEKGIFISSDRGFTWTKSSSGLIFSGNAVTISNLIEKKGILFGGGATNVSQGIYTSVDTGATWVQANTGLPNFSTVYTFFIDADTLYAGLKEGLYRTTNNGTNWTKWGTGIAATNIYGVAIKNDTMYAANGSSNIYRSINRGQTWVAVKTNQTIYVPYKLFVYGDKLLTITGTNQGNLYWCADTGATWTELNASVFGSNAQALHIVNNNMISQVSGKGMQLSTNGGSTWTQINQGLYKGTTQTLTASYVAWDMLYSNATEGGVVRRALVDFGVTKVEQNKNEVPSTLLLSQNYPNPFNPTTNIEFQIPLSGFVTLKVYDAMGREVATLVNEQMNVGSYKTAFNGARLSSGVYFYRLKVGSFFETKRMLLLK